MHLCGIMLMGLTLVITMAYDVHASEAGQAKVKEYLSKINGDVIVCPVGDSKVEADKGGPRNFLLYWYGYVAKQTTKIFANSGLNLTFRLPRDVPVFGLTALTISHKWLTVDFQGIPKPDGSLCKGLADSDVAFWRATLPLLWDYSNLTLYQQYKKVLGCDVGVLFIHRSDPFFAQGRSGVARRGNYCTDNSHLSIFLFGGADYSATLIAHEMGHLLGLGHDKDGVTAMPKGTGPRPTDVDGMALYDEVEEQCVTKSHQIDDYLMDPEPLYHDGKVAFSKCSLARLAYDIYRKKSSVRCLPGMN